jgi:regulatory protein
MNRKNLDADGLWDYALRALAQRPHPAAEIREKLAHRAASASDLETVMAKLRDYGFADDRQFSEAFAIARLHNDGFGRLRVLRDLRGRRISPAIAAEAVQKAFEGVDERDLIERFLKRKYRATDLTSHLKEPKHLAAAYRRLRMAGFSSSGSIAALKRYSEAAGELDGVEQEE